jgi:hypothetical protein
MIHDAVPWLRRLALGLSQHGPVFDPMSVQVIFVVDKMALGQVFLPVLRFPLSVRFRQCSVLIFVLLLLDEAWETSNKQTNKQRPSSLWEIIGLKSISTLFSGFNK